MTKRIGRAIITAAGDAVLVVAAYVGAFILRFGTFDRIGGYFDPVFLAIMTAGYLVVFFLFELYDDRRAAADSRLFARIALAVGAAALTATVLKYAFFLFPVGRGVLVIANVLAVALLVVWRKAAGALFRKMNKPAPVVILGTVDAAGELIERLREESQNYQFLGILSESAPSDAGGFVPGTDVPILGAISRMGGLIDLHDIRIAVLALPGGAAARAAAFLLAAHTKGVDVVDVREMLQRLTGRIPIDLVPDEIWFLTTKEFGLADSHLAGRIKRLFDVVVGGALLALCLLFWPIIALLIKVESRGPVFYSQTRIGKNGRPFRLHKFRSMIETAEKTEPKWAEENDRRATRVGRVLRAIHADEWPQLWNVLRGEMSLVGPRPERPEFVEALTRTIPFYALRHFVRPGLTGWAQINYGYAASAEDSKVKLEYDLYYISKMNLLGDIHILARTLSRIVLRDKRR